MNSDFFTGTAPKSSALHLKVLLESIEKLIVARLGVHDCRFPQPRFAILFRWVYDSIVSVCRLWQRVWFIKGRENAIGKPLFFVLSSCSPSDHCPVFQHNFI